MLFRRYLLETEDVITGGFSKWPGSTPDPFHTYFTLCGLSFINESGLEAVMPSLNVSQRAYEHLRKLQRNWKEQANNPDDTRLDIEWTINAPISLKMIIVHLLQHFSFLENTKTAIILNSKLFFTIKWNTWEKKIYENILDIYLILCKLKNALKICIWFSTAINGNNWCGKIILAGK